MQIVFINAFVFFLSALTPSIAIRCYICGTGAEEPFKNNKDWNGDASGLKDEAKISTTNWSTINPIIRSCQDFEEKQNSPEEFRMECPPRYTGCIVQIEGNRTTRTCEIYGINDCQTANGIRYCYCNSDLCNGEKVSTLTRAGRNYGMGGYLDRNSNDDEDLVESSGMEEKLSKGKNEIGVQSPDDLSIGTNKTGIKSKIDNFLLALLFAFCSTINYIPDVFEFSVNARCRQ